MEEEANVNCTEGHIKNPEHSTEGRVDHQKPGGRHDNPLAMGWN